MRKIIVLTYCFILLNGCAQSTALIGPAITVGNTGNVMQAGFSYGSNMAIKKSTGKTPGEHVGSYVVEKKEEKRIRNEMASFLESHINTMRKKLSIKE